MAFKDNKLYEWAIYVSKNKTNRSLTGYDAILDFNPDELASEWNYKMAAYASFLINKENFESLLLGYMADFSDEGRPPAHVTFENVMKLTEEIRQSLN